MEFNEFSNYVCEKVGERLGEEYHMDRSPMIKNNGIVLHRVSFRKDESNVTPSVYLEPYYYSYEDGLSLEVVIESMIDIFENCECCFDLDINDISYYEKIKKRICCKLVNFTKNRMLTEECPYVRVLDLCVIFYISINFASGDEGSVRITNTMMEEWGVTLTEIYETALYNTKKMQGVGVTNIRDIFSTIVRQSKNFMEDSFLSEAIMTDRAPMYILSNNRRFYGATSLLYTDEINKFANAIGSDLYILPSSVHEVILIPDFEEADPAFLYTMVKEVNENEVEETEILSTNVYKFERESKQVFEVFGA